MLAPARLKADAQTKAGPIGRRSLRLHERVASPSYSPSQLSSVAWSFASTPIWPVRPKLTVGPSDHPLEREADAVADRIMRMPEPLVGAGRHVAPAQRITERAAQTNVVSRKCSSCEEDAGVRRAVTPGASEPTAQPASASVERTLTSPGEPLSTATRSFFEPRFGRSFAAIRIHTGEAAAQSARSIGALAYTRGTDIVFDEGRYQPNSATGRHLLAHELTHTIQAAPHVVKRAPNAAALFGVSATDATDSEPTADEGESVAPALQENAEPEVAVSAKRDDVIRRVPNSCPPYVGYSSARRVSSYNCAGLAHRTYDRKPLRDTQALLAGGASTPCGTACASNKVKHWLWQYDLHFENPAGARSASTRDFHTVAGTSTGADPTDVYSKNGGRPGIWSVDGT